MINYYKKIPKKFLNNVPNPQYKQHLIKTPMRLICAAPSGSGKSTFVLNLLQRFSSGEGTFHKIFIITKDSEPRNRRNQIVKPVKQSVCDLSL